MDCVDVRRWRGCRVRGREVTGATLFSDLAGAFTFAGILAGASVLWILAGACLPENRARARGYRARRRAELERAGYRFRR